MKTTVSSRGQIVLPVEIRRQDGIRVGEQFEIERVGQGEYRLTRVAPPANAGVVEWLLSCPVKGYFEPVRSGSTDEL